MAVPDSITETPGYHPVLTHWNPLDPGELADPYPTFAMARKECPVFYSEFFNGWVVTRYDEIIKVVKDTSRFSNAISLGTAQVPAETAHLLPDGLPWSCPSLENNDPPRHTRIRKLANEAFKPSVIAKREPEITQTADALIDVFIDNGQADLVSQFANLLPGYVMCDVLGVPKDMTEKAVRWADQMVMCLDPSLSHDELVRISYDQADFYAFLQGLIADRRSNPGQDIITRLLEARIDEGPALTDSEVISAVSHFLIAGNETTRKLIGNMIYCLLRNPDQLTAVYNDHSLIDATVQETLRYITSVRGLPRITTEDVEVGGVRIPEGQFVAVMWSSANHDETKFEDPEKFNIFRDDSDRHIAFNRGPHFCIGAPLATLETRIALFRLLDRLPNLRRANDEPLEWEPLVLHMGLKRLDIAWDRPS